MYRLIPALFIIFAAAVLPPAASAARPPQAIIGATSGLVQVKAKGSDKWVTAQPGQVLAQGMEIRTAGGGEVVLAFADNSKLRLGSGGQLKIDSASGKQVSVFVSRGKVDGWVNPASGNAITVRNPVSSAKATKGSVFSVAVAPSGKVTMDVFSGNMKVTDNFGRTTSVAQGQRVEATQSAGATAPEAMPAQVAAAAPVEPTIIVPETLIAAAPTAPEEEAAPDEVEAEEPDPTEEVVIETSPVHETTIAEKSSTSASSS